jgi:hypothetical protein
MNAASTRTLLWGAGNVLLLLFLGLHGGRNLALTAGADLGFRSVHDFHPAIEVRGTYPVDGGTLDAQRNVLAGPRLSRAYSWGRPYVDFLVGRGQINYKNNGYPAANDPRRIYLQTASNVFSPGGGITVDVTRGFRLMADAQYQRYSTPVTSSGHLYAKAFTLGIEYRIR